MGMRAQMGSRSGLSGSSVSSNSTPTTEKQEGLQPGRPVTWCTAVAGDVVGTGGGAGGGVRRGAWGQAAVTVYGDSVR